MKRQRHHILQRMRHLGCVASVFCLALISLTLSGCRGKGALLGRSQVSDQPVIQLGLVGAAYGPGGLAGGYAGDGASLAVSQINAAGGVTWQGKRYNLALAYGVGNDIAGRISALLAATPPVVALIGPDEAAPITASLPLLANSQVPDVIMTSGAIAPLQPAALPANILRLPVSDAAIIASEARYLATYEHEAKIAVVTESNDYGREGKTAILAQLAQAHSVPVSQIELAPGDDGLTAARSIRASGATMVWCWLNEAEAAQLLQQLRGAQWPGRFMVGQLDADFMALAGVAGDGVVGASMWDSSVTTPANAQFVASFEKQYGMAPDEHAAEAYDAVMIIARGIAAVGSQTAALTAYLQQVRYQGALGALDPQQATAAGFAGDMLPQVTLAQVTQGKATPLTVTP